jgi:Sulfotransferase domain
VLAEGGSGAPVKSVPDVLWMVRGGMRWSTCRLRPLPDFLIIGGQRCGTTSHYYYLRAHPQVLAALVKEVHFLSLHWTRGEGWYRAQFPLRAGKAGRRPAAPLTFEATPYYLAHPLAPSRAAPLLPEVKLLVLLRDPVSRAWSHYRHMVRLGLEPLSFEEAIAQEPARLAGEVERIRSDPHYDAVRHRRYSYLARGAYAEQLQQWLGHFPPTGSRPAQRGAVRGPRHLLSQGAGVPRAAPWAPSSFPSTPGSPRCHQPCPPRSDAGSRSTSRRPPSSSRSCSDGPG